MTQPTQEAAPPVQPPPTQSQTGQDAAIVAAIATLLAILAAGAITATTASVVTSGIAAALGQVGVSRTVALALIDLSGTHPTADATSVRFTPHTYRAAYLLNAARRVTRDMASGTSLADALAAERPLWVAHLAAQQARQQAADRLDAAVRAHGPLLGWRSRRDANTTAECSAADGKNFYADRPTTIGLPGALGPHPGCRCRPVAPFPNASILK